MIHIVIVYYFLIYIPSKEIFLRILCDHINCTPYHNRRAGQARDGHIPPYEIVVVIVIVIAMV